jgi:MYXO-CTERM domain-containing protein
MQKLVCAAALVMAAGAANASIVAHNNIPGTFIDISGTGTDSGVHGDDSSGAITLTHGNLIIPAGQIFVSSNGTATFAAFSSFSNTTLGPSNVARGYAPFWDDQRTDRTGSAIRFQNLADRSIIQWNTTQFGVDANTAVYELQIFDDAGGGLGTGPGGALAQFVYQSVSLLGNGISATIGAIDSTGSIAQWSNNTASVGDGQTVSIIPAPGSLALLGLGGLLTARRRRA